MTPTAKFNSIIVAVTTAIMYLLWIGIDKLSPEFMENNCLLVSAVAFLSSLGFYRLLTNLLKTLFEEIRFIKKFILGDRYLEGTWVGFYMSSMGEVRYLYERYEQSLEEVAIFGRAYKEDKSLHGKWTAINPTIDCKKKNIAYYYETDMTKNTHINQGFASFSLEKTGKNKCYNKMQGFSSDLNQTDKINAIEIKISDDCWDDERKILQEAEKVYKNNKEFLL